MKRWQNFFLQRMGSDTNGSPYPVCESVGTWGVWCKEIPFKIFDKVKEPAKYSWPDEDGDDEYMPVGGVRMEAYTMKVELGCRKQAAGKPAGTSAVNDVRAKVGGFLDFLRSGGMLKVYSSYTRIGRQMVRLESVGESATWKSDDEGEFLVFEVTLKVNDPVTDINAQMKVVA